MSWPFSAEEEAQRLFEEKRKVHEAIWADVVKVMNWRTGKAVPEGYAERRHLVEVTSMDDLPLQVYVVAVQLEPEDPK